MSKTMRAIGLMSGTSMDGIDLALIETDGEDVVKRGPTRSVSYDAAFRAALVKAVEEARSLAERGERTPHLAQVERDLTERHAAAVQAFMAEQSLSPDDVAAVGFHGQTVLHKPLVAEPSAVGAAPGPRMLTVQLGDGPLLARTLGVDVVYDLRAADVAAGGQGAPLAPAYHRALAARLPERPVVVLNLGGVANVTWIGRNGTLLAFDTGPGGALIDDWMLRHTRRPIDVDGCAAARGRVDERTLTSLLSHEYFKMPLPKSLDRNVFSLAAVEHLSVEDGAATLAAFTAASVARAREQFPEEPALWVVVGGGRRNKTLMAMIAGRVECAVAPAEAAGFDGDATEAEAWAYLAVRSLKGLPISFPGTTGVPRPMTGGVLARGR